MAVTTNQCGSKVALERSPRWKPSSRQSNDRRAKDSLLSSGKSLRLRHAEADLSSIERLTRSFFVGAIRLEFAMRLMFAEAENSGLTRMLLSPHSSSNAASKRSKFHTPPHPTLISASPEVSLSRSLAWQRECGCRCGRLSLQLRLGRC